MEDIKFIINSGGNEIGKVLYFGHPCELEDCNGALFSVKWADGEVTFPCSKGLEILDEETAKILA